MNIFGIGPLEIAFIILLAIIIFGPKDIAKTSKTVGNSLNKFVRSDAWKTISQTSRELQHLPNRLMREAGLEELENSTREQLEQVDATIKKAEGATKIPDAPPGVILPADHAPGIAVEKKTEERG